MAYSNAFLAAFYCEVCRSFFWSCSCLRYRDNRHRLVCRVRLLDGDTCCFQMALYSLSVSPSSICCGEMKCSFFYTDFLLVVVASVI